MCFVSDFHLLQRADTLLAMQNAVLATAIPSVCLLHAGTLSRRMKVGSCGLHCEIPKKVGGRCPLPPEICA